MASCARCGTQPTRIVFLGDGSAVFLCEYDAQVAEIEKYRPPPARPSRRRWLWKRRTA
jgi:hypothetical protein